MCGYHIPQPQPCQLSEKPQLSEVSTGSPILRRSESLERKGRIYGERYGEKPDIEKKSKEGVRDYCLTSRTVMGIHAVGAGSDESSEVCLADRTLEEALYVPALQSLSDYVKGLADRL